MRDRNPWAVESPSRVCLSCSYQHAARIDRRLGTMWVVEYHGPSCPWAYRDGMEVWCA